MSQFEFFMAIASVAMGLGLAELARFWGVMLREANRGQVGFVRLAWSITLMIGSVMYWVGMWTYEDDPFSHYHDAFALVLPSLLIVLACHALTGRVDDDQPGEDTYFWRNRRVIYLSFVASGAGATWADWMLLPTGAYDLVSFGLFAFGAVGNTTLAFVGRPWMHGVWAGYNLVILGLFAAFAPLTMMAGTR